MSEINHNSKVIAVLDDLFFGSKIREAAKSLNINLELVKSTDGLTEKVQSAKPSLVIFDLNLKAGTAVDAIRHIKSSAELKEIPVLGFLSHVQTDLRDEAIEAGCNPVLPRSKFSKDLREILAKYAA